MNKVYFFFAGAPKNGIKFLIKEFCEEINLLSKKFDRNLNHWIK